MNHGLIAGKDMEVVIKLLVDVHPSTRLLVLQLEVEVIQGLNLTFVLITQYWHMLKQLILIGKTINKLKGV